MKKDKEHKKKGSRNPVRKQWNFKTKNQGKRTQENTEK